MVVLTASRRLAAALNVRGAGHGRSGSRSAGRSVARESIVLVVEAIGAQGVGDVLEFDIRRA
jgi:hypothetical protein